MSRQRAVTTSWLCYLLALTVAYGAKRFYSSASVDELGFVLAPTAKLVEAWFGLPFTFEHGIGYTNLELAVAVTKACSGVNFLIIAFVSLVLGFTSRLQRRCGVERQTLAAIGWFFFSGVAAYLFTLAVNAVRVVVATTLHREHLLEGIAIYLCALSMLHAVVSLAVDGARWTARFAVLPLCCYGLVTLAVPVLNGAVSGTVLNSEFGAYAAKVVLAVATVLGVLFAAEKVLGRQASTGEGRKAVPVT